MDDGSRSIDHIVKGKKKADSSKSEKKDKKRGSAATVVAKKQAVTAKKPAGKKAGKDVSMEEVHVENSD
jgi:hypothetical protein